MKNLKVHNLLEISMALSTENDFDRLFDKILNVAMEITNCDGGTIYSNSGEVLKIQASRMASAAGHLGQMEEIAVSSPSMSSKSICDHATIDKSESMLIVPMQNHYDKIVGVIQLVNARDSQNNKITFDRKCEEALKVLASLAAVCITNVNHLRQVKTLFDSFVGAISSAIDERTPYNGSHTRNMVKYGEAFLAYMNEKYRRERGGHFFTENQEEQFVMSIWLHDTGKIAIPRRVMNKDTRLGSAFTKIEERFIRMLLLSKIQFLEHHISEIQYEKQCEEIKAALELIRCANKEGVLPTETVVDILALGDKVYKAEDGTQMPWLTSSELKMLQIQKGTLSDEEREIMEQHVVITKSLLERINFTSNYDHVVEWAANHHEFLDGSGYPNRLKGDELSVEVRLLTILDIFDALTATDRPYKDPVSVVKALNILGTMVEEGKLDGELVAYFKESEAWKVEP